MPELDFTGLRTAAEDAARQPEFDVVKRRANRFRARGRAAAVGAAASLALVVGAAAYALPAAQPSGPDAGAAPAPSGPFPPAPPAASPTGTVPGPATPHVQWAAAADTDHIYALLNTDSCEPGASDCTMYLYASEDGGQSWQPRGPAPATLIPHFEALTPEVLLAYEAVSVNLEDLGKQDAHLYLSTDGGHTWKVTEEADDPVAAVPEGQQAMTWPDDSAKICAYDPDARVLAPLATQPDILVVDVTDAPGSAGVWISGYERDTHKPAVAVSHDGGKTWATHVFTEGTAPPTDGPGDVLPTGWAPDLATTDGQTAYAVLSDENDHMRVYRSTNGGATWPLLQETGTLPHWTAFVTPDGSHVALEQASPGLRPWISRDGGPYVASEFTGIPPFGVPPTPLDGGGFLAWTDDYLYASDDGLSWRRLG
jgi:hypothetical protein